MFPLPISYVSAPKFFDDIVEDCRSVLGQVYAFLGVPPISHASAEVTEKINKAPEYKMPKTIERLLTQYFRRESDFIQARFRRTLRY